MRTYHETIIVDRYKERRTNLPRPKNNGLICSIKSRRGHVLVAGSDGVDGIRHGRLAHAAAGALKGEADLLPVLPHGVLRRLKYDGAMVAAHDVGG